MATTNHPLAYRRPVTIHVQTVGQNFGHVGVIRCDETARVLEETAVVPFGMQHRAEEKALELAAKRGYKVVA